MTSLHFSIEVLMVTQFYFVGRNNFGITMETGRGAGRGRERNRKQDENGRKL
jgi:hypothetical protein